MKRFVAVLAAGAALSGLGIAGAGQAAATPTGTTTCGYGVGAQVCLTIDGRLASATGWVSSTGGPAQLASFELELRTTGGAILERENLGAVVPAGGITVGPVASTVPCGTGVTATFTTTRAGRPTVTATVTVPAVC
ncbi:MULTISPECIES: hypothetical protein [Kitasatospora]|uniref:hypothetical protein n=1 Tax=Kitasatospora TaxID=2063 RepID=UPI0004C1140B|nr:MULTISPECIES: hypothetical protein [Kitasatospora]